MGALHRDLRGQPASEGQAHERHFLERQRVEDIQVELDQVVHGLEVRRPGRLAEAGV